MEHEESGTSVWSLTSSQLAKECRLIAEGNSPAIDKALRDEARRLQTEWKDAIHMPEGEFGDKARRAAQMAALRKRTIEILVKVSPQE
ncbi:MAG: hypothetical protein ABSE99_00380 [Terracidiphilus sp.]|jgi:hypothetical protein